MFWQAKAQGNSELRKGCRKDTIDVVVLNIEKQAQIKNKEKSSLCKVLKIDDIGDCYLIFIEKGNTKATIYSKKRIGVNGRKLEIDSTYYFELVCKDTLYNGSCLHTVPNVTYFGKYLGSELGELYVAKNLYGLILFESLENKRHRKY
jgi:hypothetical protein